MFEHLGMGDQHRRRQYHCDKWETSLAEDEDNIRQDVGIVTRHGSGYSAPKLLLTLETVRFLTMHHTEDQFPFLAIAGNARHRTTFHAALTRLLSII
jgi:hypothetical protein